MFLDNFFQIPSPCFPVLFGNEWRTLLTIGGVPNEWLEVEMLEKGFVLGVVEFHNFTINLRIQFSNCFQLVFYLIFQNVPLILPCIRDIVDDSLQHNQFVKLAFHISYFLYMEVLQVEHQNIHSHIYHEKKFPCIKLLHAFLLLRNVLYQLGYVTFLGNMIITILKKFSKVLII